MSEIKEIKVLGEYIVLTDRKYTETDEWAKVEGDLVVVGVTDYAQKKLKDIVGVVFEEIGKKVNKGDIVAELESIKSRAEVYAPITGKIIEVNTRLEEEPDLVNSDPYGKGWLVKIKPDNVDDVNKLLTPEQYAKHIEKREKS